MLWKNIKDIYQKWPVDVKGYYDNCHNFKIKIGEGNIISDSVQFDNYVELNNNISIYDNVKISTGTKIGNSVTIHNNTKIGAFVTIGKHTYIGENVKIGSTSTIENNVTINSDAYIGNGIMLNKYTVVSGGANLDGECINYISGSQHPVYLSHPAKRLIGIGCMIKSIDDWKKEYKTIGKSKGYTKEQIKEYGMYINLFDKLIKGTDNKE